MNPKVITLTQPWASLVVHGFKKFDTRSWKTRPDQLILIHASNKITIEGKRLIKHLQTNTLLETGIVFKGLIPMGAIIGGVLLNTCYRSIDGHFFSKPNYLFNGIGPKQTITDLDLSVAEKVFGDFSQGRYAWELQSPFIFNEVIRCAGQLGLWDYPIESSEEIVNQIPTKLWGYHHHEIEFAK